MHRAETKLRQKILNGHGQGHGSQYQPWLRITRRGGPSNANLIFQHLPMFNRHGHFLSRNEWNVAIWLLWLGVDDLREQFPLWPWKHPHPLYGHPRLDRKPVPYSRGTLAIARDLGIEHGRTPGWSGGVYVATTDLMITLVESDQLRSVAIAVKPKDIVNGSREAPQRIKERLILEMAYAKELGIRWLLLSDEEVPNDLRKNLNRALPASQLSLKDFPPALIADFCEAVASRLSGRENVGEAIEACSTEFHLEKHKALALFSHGIWHRSIPIDLRHDIVMGQPAVLTDFSWVDADTQRIFGGQHG